MLQDAKIICGEVCVEQHQLLVVDLRIRTKERKEVKFVPKLKVWLLRDSSYRRGLLKNWRRLVVWL